MLVGVFAKDPGFSPMNLKGNAVAVGDPDVSIRILHNRIGLLAEGQFAEIEAANQGAVFNAKNRSEITHDPQASVSIHQYVADAGRGLAWLHSKIEFLEPHSIKPEEPLIGGNPQITVARLHHVHDVLLRQTILRLPDTGHPRRIHPRSRRFQGKEEKQAGKVILYGCSAHLVKYPKDTIFPGEGKVENPSSLQGGGIREQPLE